MNTAASKIAFGSLCALLISVSDSVSANDISTFSGVRIGWMGMDSQRTSSFNDNDFYMRDGFRTFSPGIEFGVSMKDDFAVRAYLDHLNAEYKGTSGTSRGHSAGVDMLFGFSSGFYGGAGVNQTELGNQNAIGARLTAGYRYNFNDRISSRFEVAHQNSATSQREFDDTQITAIVQYTFGMERRALATPEETKTSKGVVDVPDSDGDGVPDYLDLCPGTPAGQAVDEFGCSRFQGGNQRFELNISFANNSAEISDDALSEIAEFATRLQQNPNESVRIEGHTDSSGSNWRNQELSQQRADAVKSILVSQFGISEDRIIAEGFGDSRPLAFGDKSNPANRRVEMVFTVSREDAGDR